MFSGLQIRQKIVAGSFGILIAFMVLAFIIIVVRERGVSAESALFIERLPIVFGVLCAALVLSGYLLWVLAGKISQPIIACSDFAIEISRGNYSEVFSIENAGEIGVIAGILKDLAVKLETENKNSKQANYKQQGLCEGIKANAKKLHETVAGISRSTANLTEKSESIAKESTTVAAATEEMRVNIASVSQAAEYLQKNMDSITIVTDEMTSTIGEITKNSEEARLITMEAKSCVDKAFKKIDILGKASEEITSVIDTIVEIAEQTKLLALNATIEAARAGEAGKGFAVVAGEVKDLAAQTNEATLNIKHKIEAMSSSTQSTIIEIKKINDVTHNMTNIVETIAAAVQEQSVSSNNIADNVSGAALQTREVNSNVVQTAAAASQITNGMRKVNENIVDIRQALTDVNSSSEHLTTVERLLLDSITS
ncbi:methyl-accepting chemotaxis protein [Desulfobacula sp.]|uniref:methyl-accepting chemotaxis protein n=1 Tax=Desulfobacula sp. TaxID=2593537 RepID=UPI002636177D|nr:methyl-accepting chemotaxis protein [Desulfobacula sp.]